MANKQEKFVIEKEFKKLLDQQTKAILGALEETTKNTRISLRGEIVGAEERIREEFRSEMDKLANTLDKFLKRLTDFSDEFKVVKARLAKVEKILQEKLGVMID